MPGLKSHPWRNYSAKKGGSSTLTVECEGCGELIRIRLTSAKSWCKRCWLITRETEQEEALERTLRRDFEAALEARR